MGNTLKAVMRVAKTNIWDLAAELDVDYMLLVDTIAGKDHLDKMTAKKVVKIALSLGLCPECGNNIVPAGGCVHCLCGWELCP